MTRRWPATEKRWPSTEPAGCLQQYRAGLCRAEKVRSGLRALRAAAQQLEATPAAAGVVYNLKGGLYLAKADAAAAEEAFRTAIQKNPNLLAPYYALAGIYLREHRPTRLYRSFKAAGGQPKQAGPHMMMR